MKASIFNFVFEHEGETIVFNTLSKGLALLDKETVSALDRLDTLDGDTLEALRDNGFIVDDNEDETAFLKYVHYRAKFSHDVLRLTIAPTLDCNFACPYCYENRRAGKMSEQTQDNLIAFVEDLVADGVKRLEISWNGGEPLMAFDVVDRLSMRLGLISKKYGCELSMSMVTNGYLLNEEKVALLERRGIRKVQITLDGLEEHHNACRPLRNGRGSYKRIVENLSLFKGTSIKVVIRMNLDNANKNDFAGLVEVIEDLDNPNIEMVYPSPVEDINKDTCNEVSEFMSVADFEAFSISSCDGCGLGDDDPFIEDRVCFCTAETDYCYVIDELGNAYKCWDEVGRSEYVCFNVHDPDDVNFTHIGRYLTSDPFADAKCRACVFLPICFGGCKFQKQIMGKSECGITDEMLSNQIIKSYLS